MNSQAGFYRNMVKSFVGKLAGCIYIVAIFAGCGSPDPETAEVTGIVRLDGQPLTSGIVTFTPEAGRSATGFIQSDGTYTLKTYTDGDGALPGKHIVTITPGNTGAPARPNFDSDRPTMATDSPIPVKYGIPGSSGLEFEVKADEANHAEFDLKRNAN
jgi:hypothetical protein